MADKYMKKMFNILSYKKNANQNYTKILSHMSEELPSRKQIAATVGKDLGIKERSYVVCGNVN
jgi:hypothetical protein